MNRYVSALVVLSIFFIAATPQLLVEIQPSSQTQASIVGYEHTQGDDPTRIQGPWMLELQTAQQVPVAQTTFDPYIILPDGSFELQQDIFVLIEYPGTASQIALYNEDSVLVDTYQLEAYCGDMRCQASERGVCEQDCSVETTEYIEQQQELQAAQQPVVDQRGISTGNWLAIVGIGVIIFVLIFLLIHLNKKKENPIQLS